MLYPKQGKAKETVMAAEAGEVKDKSRDETSFFHPQTSLLEG